MYDREERRARAIAQFNEVMALPSISKMQSKWMNQICEYFDNYEFESAFSLLTAVVKENGLRLSNSDLQLLAKLADYLSVPAESWNGVEH
jgi:hypothetical protein